MKVLIVDCYDSFTYNLYQQVGKLGAEPIVLPCDTPLDTVQKTPCDRIILSPGPGTPQDAGICPDVLETMSRKIPTLGVCLGHQVICTAFGGEVVRAPHLMHGKTSVIRHRGTGIFDKVPTPFIATRYHSFIAQDASLPDDLEITATSTEDGYIMGVRHRSYR
ncbi:aminodeoxychorismate/anthranilate synthase component II, partial [Methanoregula sp.]|uniref:anthranilate synthase component II n=1 Tax=Methanoregula sp. TaxID=2052170 RepID=UPI000CAD35DD